MSYSEKVKISVFQKILLVLAAIACAALAFIYIWDWTAALSSPFSIAFEGPMLWTAAELAQGHNIYALEGLNHAPWLVTIYTPLYLVFAAAIVKVCGMSYFPLRIGSMLFSAALAFLLYRIFRKTGCSLQSTLCALAFYFSFDVVTMNSFVARPDMFLMVLSAVLLDRFVSAESEPSNHNKYIPVVLLAVVTFMAKQQAIVFIVSIALYLLANKRFNLSAVFAGASLSLIALLGGLIHLACGGFFQSLSFLAPVKSVSPVLVHNLGNLGLDWIKLLWALLAVPTGIIMAKKLDGIKSYPFILLTVSVGLFMYSMGIPASNTNHMMVAFLALSWCLAICFDKMPFWIPLSGLLCCFVSYPHLAEEGRFRPLLLPHAQKAAERLKALQLKGKNVLTDDVYINVLTESKPVFVDCATFLNVWEAKNSDFRQLTDPLSKHEYAAIIINMEDAESKNEIPNFWNKKLVKAIKQNYKKVDEVQCAGWGMNVYLPANQSALNADGPANPSTQNADAPANPSAQNADTTSNPRAHNSAKAPANPPALNADEHNANAPANPPALNADEHNANAPANPPAPNADGPANTHSHNADSPSDTHALNADRPANPRAQNADASSH